MSDSRHSGLQAFSSLNVDRGFYTLRYVSAGTPETCPVAEVHLPADSDKKVRLVAAPGSVPGVLSGPGSCVVLVVEAPVTLTIGLRPFKEGGSVDATIRLEPLETTSVVEARQPAQAPDRVAPRSWQETDGKYRLVAHVARRGDVAVDDGQWVAGPDAPAAIEGLTFHMPDSSRIRIEVQVLAAGPKADWSNWAAPGEFVGSKGRARPLVGARFRLAGDAPAGTVLSVDGMFLGSPVQNRRGAYVELVNSFGTDPLVGLRVALVREGPLAETQGVATAEVVPSSKIKIFRAKSSR